MAGHQPPVSGPGRTRQVTTALRLAGVSVVFGIMSSAESVGTGLADRSLSVMAAGLGVLADVTGSATLVWRFRAERRQPKRSQAAEARAAIVVAATLAIVSAVITIQAIIALATGSRPGTSGLTLIVAAVSLVVLTPLAYAKRRFGTHMASRALQGDGTLSGIGAATSLLALTALALYHALRWWWADRVAALVMAAIAAAGAWHTPPHRQPPT